MKHLFVTETFKTPKFDGGKKGEIKPKQMFGTVIYEHVCQIKRVHVGWFERKSIVAALCW